LWGAEVAVSGGVMTNTQAVMPSAVSTAHKIFRGVVLRQNEIAGDFGVAAEDRKRLSRGIPVRKTGDAPVRVEGPCAAGDILVRQAGADYLVPQSRGDLNAPIAGVAQQAIADPNDHNPVVLILVTLGQAGGGTTGGDAVWA
jgi:hypothetical protein